MKFESGSTASSCCLAASGPSLDQSHCAPMKKGLAAVVLLSLWAGTSCEFLKRHAEGHALLVEESAPVQPATPPKPIFGPEAYVLGVIAPGTFLVGLAAVVALRHAERQYPSNDMEVVEREPENLDEDVYGAGVATLVRDAYSCVEGKGDIILRVSRLSSSFPVAQWRPFCLFFLREGFPFKINQPKKGCPCFFPPWKAYQPTHLTQRMPLFFHWQSTGHLRFAPHGLRHLAPGLRHSADAGPGGQPSRHGDPPDLRAL